MLDYGSYLGGTPSTAFTSGRVVSSTPTGGGASAAPAAADNSDLLKKLLKSLNTSSAAATADQNKQYGDLQSSVAGTKSDVQGSYNSALANLADSGNAQKQTIANNLVTQNGKSEQDLTNRGLGNTTIRSSVMAGNNQRAQQAGQAVDEGVNAQKSQVLQGQAGAQLQLGGMSGDAILSKHIQSPDMNAYLSLLSQLGMNTGQAGGQLGNLNTSNLGTFTGGR